MLGSSLRVEVAASALLGAVVLLIAAALPASTRARVSSERVVHGATAGGPVVIVPQRPGANLVLLREGDAAGTDPRRLVRATKRPGAAGGWVLLTLPADEATVYVEQNGRVHALTVRTGGPDAPVELTGPDGPECATALLGAHLAGADEPATCPSGALLSSDAAALRAVVAFIAARGTKTLTLVGDASPRSRQAAEVVDSAAERAGITVIGDPRGVGTPPGGVAMRRGAPIVVVAGWQTAEATLRDLNGGKLTGQGAYLSPWLLSAPLLTVPVGALLPLSFSPAADASRRYLSELDRQAPGVVPTGSGYRAWAAGSGIPDDQSVRLHAPASMDLHALLPHGRGGHVHGAAAPAAADWIPGGRLTAVSGPLPAR